MNQNTTSDRPEVKNRFSKIIHLFILSLFVMIMATVAQATDYRLIITDTGDNTTHFLVDEHLIINFNNDKLNLQTSDGEKEFIFDEIKKISYETDYSSVTEILRPGNNIRISSESISISMPDEKEHTYAIYDIQGKIIESSTFIQEHNLSLSKFIKGIYVLKIETFSPIKFIVK